MFQRALFVMFVFVSLTCCAAAGHQVVEGPFEAQKDIATTNDVDENKGVALSTVRELYVLDVTDPDCYFCQNVAGQHPDVEGMFTLIKGDPSPLAHYTCQMQGRGYWADVERECPSYAATRGARCMTPPGEFWVELTRRQYTEGEEVEYFIVGDTSGEAIFTPKPGSKAKPEWVMMGRVTSAPPSQE